MTSKMTSKKQGQSMMEKLPEYKMIVINTLMQSEKISKLLYYSSPDALFRNDLTDKQREDLLYSHIYPYRFMPNPVENQGTFITIGANGFRRYQEGFTVFDNYVAGEINFFVFTHMDLMRTDSGVRQDLILGELERLFDNVSGLGMGKLKLRSANELWMHNNKFGGYSVAFTITDFS
jgi:hypothetical protein